MTTLGDTAIGWSAHSNAFAAGQAAARGALKGLSEPSAQCALVFGSSWFDQAQLIGGVRSVVHSTPILGGSTAGEITPDGPKTHSCVVLLIGGSDLAVGIGHGLEVDRNPRLAGYHTAQQALKMLGATHRAGLLFFGDGLLTGYAEVLRGIQEVLGTSSLVTGALMADDLRFAQTYQYHDEILSGSVVGMLLGGACTIGVGVEHGFEPISKPRQITRARANVLYELDGQPASSVYDEYFGPALREAGGEPGLSRHLVAYPLGVQLEATGQFLLRNIRSFGSDGSLSCTGEITEGGWVQLMIGSREPALHAAERAAQHALQSVRHPRFVLVFDSVVRKRLLGRDAAEEIRRIRQAAGPDVPVLGCYTYGEQTPLGTPYPYGRSSVQTGACLIVAVGR